MLINIKYFCPNCKKNLEGKLNPDMPEEAHTEDDIKRAQNYFLSSHKRIEHTNCSGCKKKILIEEQQRRECKVKIVGKGYEKREGAGDTGLRIYYGIFCKDCLLRDK
ncbi:MAG: hypothetical protein Q8P26_01340 [Candidatus Levybacteria bacterium]|nr:hypothetical protein [Candidatus Levybacteria bacterium]